MKYLNAKTILPQAVLEQLQQYAEGELLYIPKRPQNRKRWGEVQGSKGQTAERNRAIRDAFSQGSAFCELAERYCLAEETVKKIIYRKL